MIDLMEINLLLLNPGYLILESIRHHHMTAWGCSLYAGSIIIKKNLHYVSLEDHQHKKHKQFLSRSERFWTEMWMRQTCWQETERYGAKNVLPYTQELWQKWNGCWRLLVAVWGDGGQGVFVPLDNGWMDNYTCFSTGWEYHCFVWPVTSRAQIYCVIQTEHPFGQLTVFSHFVSHFSTMQPCY